MAVIQYLTTCHFDHGALAQLPAVVRRAGISRAFVVTDAGVKAAGLLDRLLGAMGTPPAAVWDTTPANPTEGAVTAALDAWRASGADGLVALGGGSSMDLAKAVGLLASHEGPLARYGVAQRGSRLIGGIPPLVAVPTTAGTGSEVSIGCMIILDNGFKEIFASPNLVPSAAICDPDLTLGLPAHLTAATGMDAVVHCLESVLSPAVNPPADAIALDGLARAVGAGMLERAVRDGSDREARWNMMMASYEGALAFGKGLGSVHALSHAAGRLHDLGLHHGLLNAMFLPHVLAFNAGSAPDKEAAIARAMGFTAQRPLADHVFELNQRLGIPARLRDIGLAPEHGEGIVQNALVDLAHATNCRPVTRGDYEALYTAALG